MKLVYLDNAATTKVDPRVVKAMNPYFSENYGNPSSVHSFGKEAKKAIDKARAIIASSINAKDEEIYFTSGGTESNNWALKELFFANPKKKHIITTKIEHPSVLEVCKMLETLGVSVTYLDVDKEGFVNIKDIEDSINENTLLVSIVHANNEIGTIQDIENIGKICKSKGVYFHIDACQSYMKTDLDVEKQNIDLMTLNAHKIHGPKGVGALFIRKGLKIGALLNGGGHEKGLRSGTENVSAIIGFGEAVRIFNKADIRKIAKLREELMKKISSIEKVKINGPIGSKRLCNNLNISLSNIEGEAIQGYLEAYGIMVSTGSACASHSLKKSHVLKALGLSELEINSSIRISLSKYTTKQEVDYFIGKLNIVVRKLRNISPFA